MDRIKLYILLTVMIIAGTFNVAAKVYSVEDVPNVQLADSTQLVSDPDNYLSAAERDSLNAILRNIRSTTTSEVTVVVVDDIDEDIDNFATDLFMKWGVGKKDLSNGVLVVVAMQPRKYAIRTGYGTEGALPDVVAGRIGRNYMTPAFREGQYGRGLIAGTEMIRKYLTDPAVRDELRSSQTNSHDDDDLDLQQIFLFYLGICLVATAILALVAFANYSQQRKKSNYDKYMGMRSTMRISGLLAWFFLGIPLLVYLPLKSMMHKWRDGRHPCPNCGKPMRKLDEEADNAHLTPAQDTEEKINSVDYDVWVCDDCGAEEVYAFTNPDTTYTVCPNCGARACTLVSDTIVRRPTSVAEGRGVKEFQCRNCHKRSQVAYKIAKTANPPVIILPGGGGGGGFGSGGFGGGNFGGGMTGGGGASGGW